MVMATAFAWSACARIDVGSLEPGQSGDVDLTDASTLARLGVPEPAIEWQRPIDRLTYAGTGRAPSDTEVALVTQVIDDVPTALLAKTDVRWIIRSGPGTTVRPDHPDAVASAVGPDIYLLDRAFTLSEGGSTRYDLARAVVHEIVHIAQFQTMSENYLNALLDGDLSQLNPVDGSLLVRDFADATGWENRGSDLQPQWERPGPASSPYGASSPGEDMAEAVALVVLGLEAFVPNAHVDWVERWVGAPADTLAIGQPWAPTGAVEVLSATPLYDTTSVASAQGSLTHAELLYFQLADPSTRGDIIATSVEEHLRSRVMSGSFRRLDDDNVPRWGGRFVGPSGRLWWVELWDFPNATSTTGGPPGPILVYVALW
jgi:hypothetical protein